MTIRHFENDIADLENDIAAARRSKLQADAREAKIRDNWRLQQQKLQAFGTIFASQLTMRKISEETTDPIIRLFDHLNYVLTRREI